MDYHFARESYDRVYCSVVARREAPTSDGDDEEDDGKPKYVYEPYLAGSCTPPPGSCTPKI